MTLQDDRLSRARLQATGRTALIGHSQQVQGSVDDFTSRWFTEASRPMIVISGPAARALVPIVKVCEAIGAAARACPIHKFVRHVSLGGAPIHRT